MKRSCGDGVELKWSGRSVTSAAERNRDHFATSVKTRSWQLRTRQINHRLGQGATKAMDDLSKVISMALKCCIGKSVVTSVV
jgi:hypothetical protein